ncbi:hypothetical protein SAMN05444170_2477 [Bradyrhizobium erythrophlei]|jgi:hypothetical protein|uniref:Uncharacterized protein n=1 Tax=Bradyrhizobium erythrophlei TaxID=1437360 RepID=A0A1M7TRT5_9BRAD|nr:hypothetical protein SAMN05444170_2477 [Bradyrhizobium erythrophlei]
MRGRDDFYLAVLAAIAASLTRKQQARQASPIAPFSPRKHSSYNGGQYGEACLNAMVGAG